MQRSTQAGLWRHLTPVSPNDRSTGRVRRELPSQGCNLVDRIATTSTPWETWTLRAREEDMASVEATFTSPLIECWLTNEKEMPMEDALLMILWVLGGFVWGVAYGRMKGQKAEDELRIKIAELNAQNRLMQRLQDRIDSKLNDLRAP